LKTLNKLPIQKIFLPFVDNLLVSMSQFRPFLILLGLFSGILLFSLNSCQKAEEEIVSPGIEIKQFEPSGVNEASLILNVNNTGATDREYGFLLISIDSADNQNYYEQTLAAVENLNTVDLYLTDNNRLKGQLRNQSLGQIKAGEIISQKEVVLDSLNRNNGYIVRAYMKSANTLIYSKAIGIKSLDKKALEYVTTLSFPFNPSSFIFKDSTVYFLVDTLTSIPELYSYSLGSSNFQTLAQAPFNNAEYPKSCFAFLDSEGKINYLAQKNGTLNKKPYTRATYDIAANLWTTQGTTCSPTDTLRHFTKFAYTIQSKLVTSLTKEDNSYKINLSDPDDYCPSLGSQTIPFSSSCDDYNYYSRAVKNSFLFRDTIYLTLTVSNNKLYYFTWPAPGSPPECNLYVDYTAGEPLLNNSFIFKHGGTYYTLKEAVNPVSNNPASPQLFLNSFTEQSGLKKAYNVSNSKTGYESILRSGICKGFAYVAPYTYIMVINPAAPGKVYVFKFKP
jgi:hypothetical protein